MKTSSFVLLLLNVLFLVSCADVKEDTDSSVARCRRTYPDATLRGICNSGVEIAREQIFKMSCREQPQTCYRAALTFCGAQSQQDLQDPQVKACADGVDFMAQAVSESSIMRSLYTSSNVLPFNANKALRTGETHSSNRSISSHPRFNSISEMIEWHQNEQAMLRQALRSVNR